MQLHFMSKPISAIFLLVLGSLTVSFAIRIHHSNHAGIGLESDDQVAATELRSFDEQLLDHFNPSESRTWSQKYFVDPSCFNESDSASLPHVLLLIGGEAGPEVAVNRKECIPNRIVFKLLHRFYTLSQPTGDLSLTSLQYLSSKQALADIAWFIEKVIRQQYSITKAPIIVRGASYPGALAVWFRVKYPHLTVGSVGLSAVIKPQMAFPQFEAIAENVLKKKFPKCRLAMQKTLNLLRNESKRVVFANLNICGNTWINKTSVVEGIWNNLTFNMAESWVQYWAPSTISRFCKDLISNPYKALRKHVLFNDDDTECTSPLLWKRRPYPSTTKAKLECENLPCTVWRPWFWQKCTEFGWFKTDILASDIFAFYKLDEFLQMCLDIYNVTTVADHIESTSVYYGGLNISAASRIVMTNDEMDPWHGVSLPPNHNTDPLGITSIMVKDAGHCKWDVETKERVNGIIDFWLKDFYAVNSGVRNNIKISLLWISLFSLVL